MNIKFNQGFTLVELMIVVAIMGIIAAIASSYYGGSVIKAKRTDGRSGLQLIATNLEKCKSMYGNYNSANCPISNGDTEQSTEGLYDIAVVSAAATFTLTATPSTESSQGADTDCTSLILNNLGQQTGTGLNPTVCW